MLDSFGRDITYLRISFTDLCNLRCRYCMPEEGVAKAAHGDILSIDEIEEITRALAGLGIKKVRLTGGEPMVRRGFLQICQRIRAIPGIEELCMTTNGLLLGKYAKDLKLAGVDRINISLDTLNADKYRYITRYPFKDDPIERIFAGISECAKVGLKANKINTVLIGGFNDDEVRDLVELTKDRDIELRFIELMPIGPAMGWDRKAFVPNSRVLELVPELESTGEGGVAHLYRIAGYKGRVGLISPVNAHFCKLCNRIRLTSDGKIKMCLHSGVETNIRGLHGEELREKLAELINGKPENYDLGVDNPSSAHRNMNQIGG